MPILKPFSFLTKHDIECRALDLLTTIATQQGKAWVFPLDPGIVADYLGLDIVWDQIPDDGQAGAIAARILPLERLIEINDALPQLAEGWATSTLAHEVGHWVLHIDELAIDRVERLTALGVHLKVVPFLCAEEAVAEGREWQAQYFATCLLMPRFQLMSLLPYHDLGQWRDLYALAAQLGVTISNLIHRLRDLGWLTTLPVRPPSAALPSERP